MPVMSANPVTPISEPDARVPRSPISRRQIEAVIARSAAILGLVFGAQTVPALLGQSSQLNALSIVGAALLFGGLLAAVAVIVTRKFVRAVYTYIAIAWVVVMVFWPSFVTDGMLTGTGRPWPWYLLTVATAAAAVAWPVWAAAVALGVLPVVYGIVRLTAPGGESSFTLVGLDVVYSFILGGMVLVIITMLRQAAETVDRAQATALERYAHAVQQHATEVERVQVDAIVHDSVLTTLLTAARTRTPEAQALAATMARNAIGHLRHAAMVTPDDPTRVRISDLADRIRAASRSFECAFTVTSWDVAEGAVTWLAAEAMFSAAAQAMVNSSQHAGEGSRRWLALVSSPTSVVVTVGDSGQGFTMEAIPSTRLGVRVSMIERVASAGGAVEIDTAPGAGTVVTIRWPTFDEGTRSFSGVDEGERSSGGGHERPGTL